MMVVVVVRYPHGSVPVTGTFKNFNTIEEFKEADKAKLFNEQAEKVGFTYVRTSGFLT